MPKRLSLCLVTPFLLLSGLFTDVSASASASASFTPASPDWGASQSRRKLLGEVDGGRSLPEQERTSRKLSTVAKARIKGGCKCFIERFPYMVSIRNGITFNHECGGILINARWVLTAAHCLRNPSVNPSVVTGTTFLDGDGERIKVVRTVQHPGYVEGDVVQGNDILLMELEKPTNKITTFASLPEVGTTYAEGEELVALGWGRDGNTQQNFLKCSDPLAVVEIDDCSAQWSDATGRELVFPPTMVCSFNEESDACQGDSGGPLVRINGGVRFGSPDLDVIAGLTSFGIDCRRGGIPGIYTSLAVFRPWIEGIVFGGSGGDAGALLKAAEDGDLKTVKSELEKGVDIETRTDDGETPLMRAANGGHIEIIIFLLDNGADIEAKDNAGFTSLIWVAETGNFKSAETLLEKGAWTEARTNNGATPLIQAAEEGHKDIVTLLLDKGAEINGKFLGTGATPLLIAAGNGHLDVVRELLNREADVSATDNDGWNAMHYAVRRPFNSLIVQALLGSGIEVNLKNDQGNTPLHLAASFGHISLVRVFIREGADKSIKNDDGNTPKDRVCDCLDFAAENICSIGTCSVSRESLVELLT